MATTAKGSSRSVCARTRVAAAGDCTLTDPTRVAYSPVEPLAIMGETIEAHAYAVCGACFTEQYERKYGLKPEGVEP